MLEIEVQGAAQIRKRLEGACLIFLLPPSLAVLEQRLRGRHTDSDAVIQRRMALVDRELAAADIFDYAIVNDDLETAVSQVLDVIHAVRRDAATRSRGSTVAPACSRAGMRGARRCAADRVARRRAPRVPSMAARAVITP